MKKYVSLILAALLLVGAMAFADTAPSPTNAVLTVSDKTYEFSNPSAPKITEGSVATDIYLQVAAEGQIDVVVPLYLVFATNIDGGVATAPSASTYTIRNMNAKAAVDVKKVAAVNDATGGMTAKTYGSILAADRDTYAVQLAPTVVKDKVWVADNAKTMDMYTAIGTPYNANGTDKYLIQIAAGETATIVPSMQTSSLSFVTDSDKAVHIMKITYTVGLNYKSAASAAALPTATVNVTATPKAS